ncbi:CPBP family intramembrane glutamic endopeptidase [Nocardia farcinica]|uniref:CAAX prenyl protease 2/Lysostaphin resistance protein A-like domain-containing protein n=1 Tax=Nocardia farcinica (strain IFM 10152) TaxID=247156 RepID=Q5Z2C1_NOCFA|nr:CPBP family intramembrane glutamic endopeptidase [Nocardia farcinica]BAD55420.1 hypothetical protein NFA_5750 [Nocardia farcinica IFM 10152]
MSVRRSGRHAKAAAAVLLPLAWNNRLLPALGLGIRGRTAAHLTFALGYARALGAHPNWLSPRGFRAGLLISAVVAAGSAAALTCPRTRAALAAAPDRTPEVRTAEWITVHIPLGTALPEELIFRATLDPLLTTALGPRPALLIGPLTFGLWHIHSARAAGDPILPTIAATTAAGVVFSSLYRRTAGAVAPTLVHLTLNTAGAVITTSARKRARRGPPEGIPGRRP